VRAADRDDKERKYLERPTLTSERIDPFLNRRHFLLRLCEGAFSCTQIPDIVVECSRQQTNLSAHIQCTNLTHQRQRHRHTDLRIYDNHNLFVASSSSVLRSAPVSYKICHSIKSVTLDCKTVIPNLTGTLIVNLTLKLTLAFNSDLNARHNPYPKISEVIRGPIIDKVSSTWSIISG